MVFARSSTAFTRAVARQGQRNFSATSLKSNAAQTTEKAAAAAKEGANAAKEGAAAAAKGSTGAAKEGAQVAQDKAATAAKEGVNAAKEGAKVAQDKASSAFDDISKKAQQLGGPVVKRVEGLLGGKLSLLERLWMTDDIALGIGDGICEAFAQVGKPAFGPL